MEEHSSHESNASSMFTATEGKGSDMSDRYSDNNPDVGFGDSGADHLVDLADFVDCVMPEPSEDMGEDDIEPNSNDNVRSSNNNNHVAPTPPQWIPLSLRSSSLPMTWS